MPALQMTRNWAFRIRVSRYIIRARQEEGRGGPGGAVELEGRIKVAADRDQTDDEETENEKAHKFFPYIFNISMGSKNVVEGLPDGLHAHAPDLRQVLFVQPGQVAGREEDGPETQGMGLLDPDQRLVDGADLAAEADLPEEDHVLGQGRVLEGGDDGHDDSQVGGGLVDRHARRRR